MESIPAPDLDARWRAELQQTAPVYKLLVAQALDDKEVLNPSHKPTSPKISRLRVAHPLSPGTLIACMTGNVQGVPGTLAVFFKEGKVVAIRTPVVVDDCDRESYEPLPPSNGRM